MNCKMGFMLQLAAFLSIGWLIRDVVTHPNQDENNILNETHSNQNRQDIGDFYFDEQKANDDNLKIGRTISQSAWSEEDKEQIQTTGNKTITQFSDEFSFKNALSYFLNMLQELKKDILGIKEMTYLQNTKDLTYPQDNLEYKTKQNKIEGSNDRPEPDTSTKYNEFEKKNKKLKSNYVIDYYNNNGNKFVDDDLETFSDESDDSSHKLDEGMHEISKTKHGLCISECAEIKSKPDKYSANAEETTAIPTSQTKISNESYKEFDYIKGDKRDDDFKPSNLKQKELKTSREKTENTSSSKTGICLKKNNDNSNNLNQENETVKPLKSAKYAAANRPQNENFNIRLFERPNLNKNNDKLSKMISSSDPSSGKYSENKADSDFDGKSSILRQLTTLSHQSSKNITYNENKPYASGMSSEKPTFNRQQEQITSLKPEYSEHNRNSSKTHKNNDGANEYSTLSLQSYEVGSEIPNYEMSPEEYKDKRLNVNSSITTITYKENEPDTKMDGQKTSNIDTGSTISHTTSGNIKNTQNLNKNPPDNLNGKKVTNDSQQEKGKNYPEAQRLSKTEQIKTQQLKDDSESEEFFENNKLNDTNRENNNKEERINLASLTTDELSSLKDSNHETQINDAEESKKSQEQSQINKESLNKRNGIRETSLDQEYEYEEYKEDFDISDEFTDIEMDEDFNESKEDELITNNINEENNDEMNLYNTTSIWRNESQVSQHTGNVMEKKSQEQYNTFLEYFYKHSNNPLFQSLKNLSRNFSQ